MRRSHSRPWRAAVAIMVAVVAVAGLSGAAQSEANPASAVHAVRDEKPGPSKSFRVQAPVGPGSAETLGLDVDLYLPATSAPAPAVLLAHGFGGSKKSVTADAERLRGAGFVVMAYSARGFGRSDGQISLDSLNYEVADASHLIDVLAARPEVAKRRGDAVIGVYGASYGGALALMLGATDPRIDAVVASITWNDLATALVPGVFKQAWSTQLFGAAASPLTGACGRFTAQLCALYTKLVGGGQLDEADTALLAASSPSTVLGSMKAPTLLMQGRQDTLFGLDQADANARQIAAAGAEVKVSWFNGGHDGGMTDGTAPEIDEWLSDHLLKPPVKPAVQSFDFIVPASARGFAESRTSKDYPGLNGATSAGTTGGTLQRLTLNGRPRIVVNPPGGLPAAISSLPGTGPLDTVIDGIGAGIGGGAASVGAVQPAQQAQFSSDKVTSPFILVGSPTATVTVSLPHFRHRKQAAAASAATVSGPTNVVLFAQLRVQSAGSNSAVGGGVEPVRVTLPADGSAVKVQLRLPATTWRFESGDTVVLSVRTTDAGYQPSPVPATFVIRADGALLLPTVVSASSNAPAGSASAAALIGIPIVLLLGLILAALTFLADRRRSRAAHAEQRIDSRPTDAPPLVIRGLTKDFRAGFRAVDDLSFTVQRGQVLGLLGPNGAGKTTALRMVTGLIRPDAGEVEIFGEKLTPGARVLTRVGCFIEGPGFLPHLSGRRNLTLFWAASGRPIGEARLEEALGIADLGTAINRRVSGYSQGMRQRLAIAQAMLGMPELLILDEPTNGLDPPQIFALRGVLRRYAESGRTVIVSSHLLGEVEQTCSHVVVMARGRLLASGTVADLAGDASELTIEVTDVTAAVLVIAALDGADATVVAPQTIRVSPAAHSPEAIVAAIAAEGIGIRSVIHGRHLEETFLAMVGSEGVV